MAIRVVLGDDHVMIREGLKALIKGIPEVEVVGEADNGRDVVRLCHELKPDIAIMDIGMPELNGVEATRQIVMEIPQTKVIALSMHSSRRVVEETLQAGAVGYVVKNSAFTELASALKNVAESKAYISPSVAGHVLQKLTNPNQAGQSPASALSPREREVLQLLTEGKKTKEIANILHLSLSTVETHRRNIMTKLQIKTLPELTKFAIREGITTA